MHCLFCDYTSVKQSKISNNGTVRDDNYRKLLFYMKDLVLFGTDRRSTYFISTKILKGNIDVVRVPQFKLALFCDTSYP